MKLRAVILSVFCFSLIFRASAQDAKDYSQSRILFLLDESSSMLQQWSNGKPKYKMANEIINRLMDSVSAVNGGVQYSLRVFGNQHTVPEHDCTDTRNEVPFSPDNRTQMSFRLDDMHPLGVTAIAYSLSEAAEHDLVDEEHYAYSIILITDGGESCNGDICGVMERLIRNKIFFKPYVLSLEDVPELKSEYACMGNYLAVTKQGDISKAVSKIVSAFRPMLTLTQAEYHKMQVIASKAPSALKVTLPTTKTEIPVDSVIKPKPADTTVKPRPTKTSSIKVGEAPEKHSPVVMKKMAAHAMIPLFVAKPSIKALKQVDVVFPGITVAEGDITVPHAGPVKITAIATGSLSPYSIPRAELTNLARVPVMTPEIKIDVPPPPPVAVKMPRMPISGYRRLPVSRSSAAVHPAPLPPLEITAERPEPTPYKMESVSTTGLKKFKTGTPATGTPSTVAVSEPLIKVSPPEPEPVKRAAEKMPKPKRGIFRMHLLYVNTFLDSDLKPAKLPPLIIKLTPPETTAVKTITTPVTKPGKPATTGPAKPGGVAKTGEYKVEHEDFKETTLEVYLTNGKGAFYNATPKVYLLDPVTNKEIKHFFRMVDDAGNPDPVTNVAVGKYDLTIAGRDDLLAHVDIQPNKRNKVFVIVKSFSLYFYYEDAPNRPVKEFTATVIQRNVDNGKVVMQKCAETREYEPGNYHVVINTFPEDVRNVDLSALLTVGIPIPQPGFVKFTPEVSTNSVSLFRELGDKFVQFATINLSDPKSQHLQIQPGKYQAHYNNGTSKFSSSERVISFQVYSTKEVEVTLTK